MNEYEKIITEITVVPAGKELFDLGATRIRLEDEAAGKFVSLRQYPDSGNEMRIDINPEEWETMRDCIDGMVNRMETKEGI